jgi:hypothetical protein
MNEINNLSGEFSDELLPTRAGAGDRFGGQECFRAAPNPRRKALVLEGASSIFIDCLKGN